MSRKFGVIDAGFWRSRKLKGASDQTRLLCVYLISCPHGNSVGLFNIPLAYIQADLGWSEKQVRIQVSELVSRRILEFDFEYDLARFVGWWRHNPIDNGKHAVAVVRQMRELRCDSDVFRNHYKALAAYARESGKQYLAVLGQENDAGLDTGIDRCIDSQTLTLTPIPVGTPPGGAVDLKKLVFDRGVALLMAKGATEQNARGLIGKWIGSAGVGAALEAIGKAESEDPADPRSFISGLLRPKAKRPEAKPEAEAGGLSAWQRTKLKQDAEEAVKAEGKNPWSPEGEARVQQIIRESADAQRRTA
ncbi:MAG: hypothetical protein EKK55_18985 [Rhodocyclaceae bacterium]|nr:MAG: hypothetical protein EKK55_18985 [Rhodocyclaceae bacterium]